MSRFPRRYLGWSFIQSFVSVSFPGCGGLRMNVPFLLPRNTGSSSEWPQFAFSALQPRISGSHHGAGLRCPPEALLSLRRIYSRSFHFLTACLPSLLCLQTPLTQLVGPIRRHDRHSQRDDFPREWTSCQSPLDQCADDSHVRYGSQSVAPWAY